MPGRNSILPVIFFVVALFSFYKSVGQQKLISDTGLINRLNASSFKLIK